jgi:imidazoleglycerol phosphate dehydratase HisB
VEIIELPLTADFQLDVTKAKAICKAEQPKMMFICSPNNPTGNLIPKGQILALAENFPGILVVDEAYIDFSPTGSMLSHLPIAHSQLPTLPNLVVLQTFSKAWGLAGIRLGMAFASKEIIAVFNKIKPPYNVNQLTQEVAIAQLKAADEVSEKVAAILAEKEKLTLALAELENVENIFPSDANFVLVQFKNPQLVFQKMQQKGIILRDRTGAVADCLRITIGTPAENETLLQELFQLENRTYVIEPKPSERTARIHRKTSETDILIELNLDRRDQSTFSTGLGFFDHMLEQISKHGNVGLKVQVKGDLHIDEHHTIEDTALALGQAFLEALGSKKGIQRYGFLLPMDDVLAQVALDFGGRPWIVWDADFTREKIGEMPTEMFYHFFKSFSDTAKCNLNIKAEGQNEHHKIEAIFKAFAKAVRMAIAKTGDDSIPSTKGIL